MTQFENPYRPDVAAFVSGVGLKKFRRAATAWCPKCQGILAALIVVGSDRFVFIPMGRAGSRRVVADLLRSGAPNGAVSTTAAELRDRNLALADEIEKGLAPPRLAPRAVNVDAEIRNRSVGSRSEPAVCGKCKTVHAIVYDLDKSPLDFDVDPPSLKGIEW
jgi:hypothetical protein